MLPRETRTAGHSVKPLKAKNVSACGPPHFLSLDSIASKGLPGAASPGPGGGSRGFCAEAMAWRGGKGLARKLRRERKQGLARRAAE